MKHLSALLCALILILSLPAAVHAEEDVYTEGTLYYTIGKETVTIVGCFGKKTEVTVPANIAGYPVNTIASGAFTSNKYIRKLNLPDTITTIESGAIPENVRVIYNANTDHPLDHPTDIITGKEPVRVPGQQEGTKTGQQEGTKPVKSAEQTTIPSSKQPSAAVPGPAGDRVMEGEVVDGGEAADGAPAGSVSASSQASAAAAAPSSAPSASQPSVTQSSEADEKPSASAAADGQQTFGGSGKQAAFGGGMVWLIAGIAAVVIAGGVIAFIIIRKKKSGSRQEKH